jgi:hypothetical protein
MHTAHVAPLHLALSRYICRRRLSQTTALVANFLETAHLVHHALTQGASLLQHTHVT